MAKMAKKKETGTPWETFTVKWRAPIFGTEGTQYHPEEITMLVSTQGGRDDAIAACREYHPGGLIVSSSSRLEVSAGVEVRLDKPKEEPTPSKKKKK